MKRGKPLRTVAIAFATPLIIFSFACGNNNALDQTPSPSPGGEGQDATPLAEDGDQNGDDTGQGLTPLTGVDLPADFPENLPIYPGATVLQSDALGEFLIVQLLAEDPLEDVVDFYETALSEGGWEIVSSTANPAQGSHTFQFTGPGLTSPGTVLVSPVPGNTAIGISLPNATE